MKNNPASIPVSIMKFRNGHIAPFEDLLVREEPLEIRLVYENEGKPVRKNISVTMRTPGHDSELAAGFLFSEGIIVKSSDIDKICYAPSKKQGEKENIVEVTLHSSIKPDIERLERHFYTTSSCGVCGKTSIELIHQAVPAELPSAPVKIKASLLLGFPDLLRKSQEIFENTGGLHAAAVFDTEGRLLVLREDIGRHNAVDKVIGYGLQNKLLPFDRHVLLLSGRGGFELVQKAIMAGIKIIASVGAPSSLAVDLAKEFNVTLAGFLKEGRFNMYSGEERIDVSM